MEAVLKLINEAIANKLEFIEYLNKENLTLFNENKASKARVNELEKKIAEREDSF